MTVIVKAQGCKCPLQLDTYVSSDPHPFPLTTWTIDLYKL
jgi:hypothetical protein